MTEEKADKGKEVDWRQRQRWSGSTLVDNEDGVGGGDAGGPFSNGSSETKLSHIYDGYADGPDDGSWERLLSRHPLSEVLPYDMNLSGSTLVSEKSRKRLNSRPLTRDGKKKIRRNDFESEAESGGGMEGKRRKPQWLVHRLAPCNAVACKPKKVR